MIPALVIVGAVISNLELLLDNFAALAGITTLFCVEPDHRLLCAADVQGHQRGVDRDRVRGGHPQCDAGDRVAQSVLLSTEMSLPAAIYGVLMSSSPRDSGFLIKRRADRDRGRRSV